MVHPYADLIGLKMDVQENGRSECSLEIVEKLLNPYKVVHGAAIYSLADTGMGTALYPSLKQGELCATIEIKITYFRPVSSGTLTCITEVVNRGKRIANLESKIFSADKLVAQANGNHSISMPKKYV